MGQKPFLSAADGGLPLAELSALHRRFGGDSNVPGMVDMWGGSVVLGRWRFEEVLCDSSS